MPKIVKREGLTRVEAEEVLQAGGYIDHSNWNGALRLRKRKGGGDPVYWVNDDPTLPKIQQFNGHQWRPSEAEQASTEWREIEFVAFEDGDEPAPAPIATSMVAEASLVPDCVSCGRPIDGTPTLTKAGAMDAACAAAHRQERAPAA